MASRDDFSKDVKLALADRVGNMCSNPECRALTSGPQEDPKKALNIGVAAHMTAAAAGGPRYDDKLSSEDRANATNGIWLCQNCAKLVDNDPTAYTVDKLRAWKLAAEDDALNRIGRTLSEYESRRRKLELAARATEIENRVRDFMNNHSVVSPMPFCRNTAARLFGFQTAKFSQERIAELYRADFSEQLAVLIPRLRLAGATFQHRDDYYRSLPAFSIANNLESLAAELHNAAAALTAETGRPS